MLVARSAVLCTRRATFTIRRKRLMTLKGSPVGAEQNEVHKQSRRFAPWALGVWMVLLLAMFGAVQYLRRADFVYLAAAVIVLVICAGCILRQGWARPPMRTVCVLLVLWALASGGLMLSQWGSFALARQHALAQPQLADLALWLIARAQRTWQVALGLKVLAIPLLGWLTWELGRPAVRRQFKRRIAPPKVC